MSGQLPDGQLRLPGTAFADDQRDRGAPEKALSATDRKTERGVLYLNAEERKTWGRFCAIAHEGDRSEEEGGELRAKAMRLALEHRGWA